jgi:hypothetical protein
LGNSIHHILPTASEAVAAGDGTLKHMDHAFSLNKMEVADGTPREDPP